MNGPPAPAFRFAGSRNGLLAHAAQAFVSSAPGLPEKLEFLSRPETYPHHPDVVAVRETHMSYVFLAGERVYKLKKPVRLPYLDFSTLSQREAACRAELHLNRRLAPAVYLDVVALRQTQEGALSLAGAGAVVDWLVVMQRLDERQMLEAKLLNETLEAADLDRLAATLIAFYRRVQRPRISSHGYFAAWQRALLMNRRVLSRPQFQLPAGTLIHIEQAQRLFLARRQALLLRRLHTHRLVDGHGDLRPEHIWLGHPLQIIDCLEFNAELRTVDPVDELAYLSLECERLGAGESGMRVAARVFAGLGEDAVQDLFSFYRCYRATMRARLAIAHLLEPNPRTPEKWPAQAKAYLAIAAREAAGLERRLRTRRGGQAVRRRAGIGLPPR